MANKAVTLVVQSSYVILDNGILKLTITNPGGKLAGIQYGGMNNILDVKLDENQRGYWDLNWNHPGGHIRYQMISGTEFSVITSSKDIVEVSFRSNSGTRLALSVDIRYIVRSGISGFYCYAIYERAAGLPSFDLVQTRMVFKLRRDQFHYMAISDEKQKIMPMLEDLVPPRGQVLALPESVLLVNPINPSLKGQMFHGTHFIGDAIVAAFDNGEAWRKVYGPVLIYLNSTQTTSNAFDLWIDAKKQRLHEEMTWPYNFVSSPYFFSAKERGSASGTLFVQDRYVSEAPIPAKFSYVGLSIINSGGSWQTESKGYQFWVVTNSKGQFTIKNVIPGNYYVHGWVPGFMGDYLHTELINISPGLEVELGNLTFNPPRDGPTVWEIGFPDRTAIGFYVPNASPMYINKLFISGPEKFRQYGLWDRYTNLHPTSDQMFMVGVNDPKSDWFFAHVNRRIAEKSYSPTTWQIKFNLNTITSGIYKLRLSIAASNHSDLQIRINDPNSAQPVFELYNLGDDSTIARHGIHGLHQLFSIDMYSYLLVQGDNTIYLKQVMSGNEFLGLMYDYLRLEAPTSTELEHH
ncbi:hypothetical protein J5N97_027324 [Dioscorea zingiberensis]|uniref:Rhamnogalacturonan endolyase n=1 Tax=Dioscorea zingiberensis TaxID=325984 RepID=A0A9D5C474_9LILI|nr:hypothetical protein J5N97_027324 [Dioscorea zingiberensis]